MANRQNTPPGHGTQSTIQRELAQPGRVLIYNMPPLVPQAQRHGPYALNPFWQWYTANEMRLLGQEQAHADNCIQG